jgi:hypothetical protein
MAIFRLASIISTVLLSLVVAACSQSLEGTYKVTRGPVQGITVSLGKNSFAFSSGASGTYEISGKNVVFTGMTFAGTMKIEGADLINEKWRFTKE